MFHEEKINKNKHNQLKCNLIIEVYEVNGKSLVHVDMNEINPTMKDISLLIYKMKQLELELVDRDWGGEGYEIIDNGDDDNGGEGY